MTERDMIVDNHRRDQTATASPRHKVALCHDWLTGMRGGERVLEELCRLYPDAPIYTLIANRSAVSETIRRRRISTSFLQAVPGIFSFYRYCLPVMPLAVRTLGPVRADVLVSTNHCVAKAIPTTPACRHVCYCFTPMRYAWTFFGEYFGRNRLKAALVAPALGMLRGWDRRTARRVTRFVAISRYIAERIRRFYGREADVVYPPVDTSRFSIDAAAPADFDLIVSALVPYKRIDLAVQAYSNAGRRLVVVGSGSCLRDLTRMAAPCVSFRQWVDDGEIARLYRTCRLLVFPGEEDFGIVPVETQASGRPVVAFGRGGVTETVVDGRTGVFFAEQTEASLMDALDRACAINWQPEAIRAHALQFDTRRFIERFAAIVEEEIEASVRSVQTY